MGRPFDISVVCNDCGAGFIVDPVDARLRLHTGPASVLICDCQMCDASVEISVPSPIIWALAWAGLDVDGVVDDVPGDNQLSAMLGVIADSPEGGEAADLEYQPYEPFSAPEVLEMLRTLADENLFAQELNELLRNG